MFLFAYVVAGIIATTLSAAFGFNKEHIGLAILGGSLLAAIISRKPDSPGADRAHHETERKGLSPFVASVSIIWISCLCLSIYVYAISRTDYYLPFEYFLAIGIAAASISAQLFFTERLSSFEERFVLLEILSLSLVLSLSFLLLFPGPYGNDSPYHTEYVSHIISTRHLDGDVGEYHNYPMYHLLIVSLMSILGNDFRTAEIAVAVTQVLLALFVFLIARRFLDVRIALLAMLLCSFSPYLLQPKYSLFPGGFAAVLFMIVLFIQFRRLDWMRPKFIGLLIFVFAVVVLSHPFAPIAIGVSFLLVIVARWMLGLEGVRIPARAGLFLLMMALLWWMAPWEEGRNLFSNLVTSIQGALRFFDPGIVGQATLAPNLPWLDVVLNDLGFSLLILFGVTGSIYVLRNHGTTDKTLLTYIHSGKLMLAIMTLAIVPIPFLLALTIPQSLPARWFPFIEVALSIMAAAGLLTISMVHRNSQSRRILGKFACVFIVLIMVFLMTTSPVANPNSHLYSTQLSTRSSLTDSEVQASLFANGQDAIAVSANSKFIYVNATSAINPENITTYINSLVLVRDYDLEKGFTIPLFGNQGALLEIIPANDGFNATLSQMNQIYDIGSVRAYIWW